MVAFTGIAVVAAAVGAVNLSAAVAMEEHTALRSPDAWLPLTAALAGWLVARLSPRNLIAWLLLAIAVSSAVFGGAALVVLGQPDVLALVLDAAGWLSAWVFLPSYWISMMLLPLLYPDGRLPSPHWRPVLAVTTAAIALETLLLATGSRETVDGDVANPWHWEPASQMLDALEPVVWVSMPVLAVLGVVALVQRIVVARAGERLPLIVFAGTVTVGIVVLLTTGMGLVLGLLLPLVIAASIAHRLHLQLREQLTLARSQAEDLRASRSRVTRAFDRARRGIERDLHDGAQQGLLALSVGLGRLADRVEPQLREEVESLQRLSRGTLVDLRRLASGTYPSALRELGVGPALREAIGPGVTVTDRLDRRPQEETEAALYFATLEAVTNARKHANASAVDVVLDPTGDGGYRFRVTDDGVGISTTTRGTGLDGMADRLGARGGTLTVESAPVRGTTVSGTAYDEPR